MMVIPRRGVPLKRCRVCTARTRRGHHGEAYTSAIVFNYAPQTQNTVGRLKKSHKPTSIVTTQVYTPHMKLVHIILLQLS